MQTGLNNRRKLFTYVFGVKYILRGCNIVEVVIEKINQFIETVLVVETGHSNINMINKVKQVLWNSLSRACKTNSAIRLLAPITLVGLTALSVEINTKVSTFAEIAACAATIVPIELLSTP